MMIPMMIMMVIPDSEDTEPLVDNNPPVVTPPADRTVTATGSLTTISLGTATAIDVKDGLLTATADTTGPFAVGVHPVTWSATDAAGNVGTAVQTVTVNARRSSSGSSGGGGGGGGCLRIPKSFEYRAIGPFSQKVS